MAEESIWPALIAAIGSSAAGAGISAAFAQHPHMAVPPPPGTAMLDPNGTAAAADQRKRQAIAGGLNSTITGAGSQPQAPAGATSGAKSTLG